MGFGELVVEVEEGCVERAGGGEVRDDGVSRKGEGVAVGREFAGGYAGWILGWGTCHGDGLVD